jgi:transposase
MHEKLLEAALAVAAPWRVDAVPFDVAAKVLTVDVDFAAGCRFAVEGVAGEHPLHDTVSKTCLTMNL